MSSKMLITGVSELLGNNLAHYFKDKHTVLGLFNNHSITIPGIEVEYCDPTDNFSISNLIKDFDPDIILHCVSSYNDYNCKASSDKTNIHAIKNITESLIKSISAKLIYISTDSALDEKTNQEVSEIIQNIKNSLALKTHVFGWNIEDKPSSPKWILKELKAGKQINEYENTFFSPIYTFELARIIDIAIQKDTTGIYNCGSKNSCSNYAFAIKLAGLFNLDTSLIRPITLDEHHLKLQQDYKLLLDTHKIEKELNYQLPSIEYSLEQFYRDYQTGMLQLIKQQAEDIFNPFKVIPYGRQSITDADIQSVTKVLKSTNLTQGPKVTEFEKSLSKTTQSEYAIAVNSGTSALHIACLAAGVQSGDEVITSPNTFVASANCAVYCNAVPVFADIDMRTFNIDPSEIEKRITAKTKAIIPVHFAGQSAEMDLINQIVKAAESRFGHKIYIVEDASHALGSSYKEKEVGSCYYSDMTVLSFHPVKHVTTGEGGAVLTNDIELLKKLKIFKSHGITNDPSLLQNNLGPWYYEQVKLGYNYRITDMQCALGVSQLKRLDIFKKRRREVVERYNSELQGIPHLQLPFESEDCNSNFHLYVILYNFKKADTTRNEFMKALLDMKILTQLHYIPVHTQPFYKKNYGTKWGDCPNAENYFKRCLSIPLYPAMTDLDINKVIKVIKKICL
jgi:perosamine synthetase